MCFYLLPAMGYRNTIIINNSHRIVYKCEHQMAGIR